MNHDKENSYRFLVGRRVKVQQLHVKEGLPPTYRPGLVDEALPGGRVQVVFDDGTKCVANGTACALILE